MRRRPREAHGRPHVAGLVEEAVVEDDLPEERAHALGRRQVERCAELLRRDPCAATSCQRRTNSPFSGSQLLRRNPCAHQPSEEDQLTLCRSLLRTVPWGAVRLSVVRNSCDGIPAVRWTRLSVCWGWAGPPALRDH